MTPGDFPSTMWSLIERAGGGDVSALRDFALRYRPAVVAYCARRGMGESAEDVAQEVFLRLHRYGVLAKADASRGRFRGLLCSITRNAIRDHARAEAGRPHVPLGDQDVAAEADEEFDREWAARLLDLAMGRLLEENRNYHDALRGFLLEGRPQAEVARAMGKSEGEVKNYVHRGKARLIRILLEEVRDYSLSRAEYEDELRHLSRFLPGP